MWQELSILELAADEPHAVNGGPFGSKLGRKDYVDEGVPVVRGVNLPPDRRFSYDGFVFVSEAKADELRANLARPRDVVVTQRGTVGQVGMIPMDCPYPVLVISQSQMKVTVNTALVDPDFVFYSLRSPGSVRRLQDLAMSAGVPHINLEMFRGFTIQVPPLAAQRKIAAVLAAYDELIENNLRRIEILEEMAQAVYREWFVSFRFPAHEDVALVDSPLGPTPEGWEVSALDELATASRGLSWNRDRETTAVEGTTVVTIPNIGSHLSLDGATKLVGVTGKERDRFALAEGDILMIGSNGNPARVGQTVRVPGGVDALCASFLMRVRCTSDATSPALLHMQLRDRRFREQLQAAAVGATSLRNIRITALRSALVAVPSDDVRRAFDDAVIPLFRLLDHLHSMNANLHATRDLLLPKLVSGEIDVSDLDIDTEWLVS